VAPSPDSSLGQAIADIGLSWDRLGPERSYPGFEAQAAQSLEALKELSSKQKIATLLTSHPELLSVPIDVWQDCKWFSQDKGMS
jgi:hypothetical protein